MALTAVHPRVIHRPAYAMATDLRSTLRARAPLGSALFLLAGAVAITVAWRHNVGLFSDFQFDDTFITLRYASHLARHGHLSWNLDDRIDGYTSPGWTVLLAVAMALGVPGESAALHGAWLAGLVGALGAVLLARRLGAHPAAALAVAGLGTVYAPGYVIWSAPGMETPYAAATATLCLLAFATPATGLGARTVPWLRALAAVACVTARPEGAALAGPLLAGELLLAWRDRMPTQGTLAFLRTLRPYLVAVGVLVTLFALHWAYYGYPLGNTYYAKRGSAILARRGTEDLLDFLRDTTMWLGPLAAVGLVITRATGRRAVVLGAYVVWFAGTCIAYARAGGDYLGFFRFYQPLVPASLAAVAALLAGAREEEAPWAWWRHLGALALAAAAGVYLATANSPILSVAWERDYGQIHHASDFAHAWRRVGAFLKRTYPPRTTMAIRAAGVIPYVTGFHCYDVLGLNNPVVAHGPITAEYPGHQREATPAQIVAAHQDIIVMHPQIVPVDLTDQPEGPLAQPLFQTAGYRYICRAMGPGEYLCLWERPGLAVTP